MSEGGYERRGLELAGLLLVVAAVLMLAGGMSRRWLAGGWKTDPGTYSDQISQTIDAGPLGVRTCDRDGCPSRGWKAMDHAGGERWLATLVAFGLTGAGVWALVVGLLALGGSVRGLRWKWMQWVFLAIFALTLLLLLALVLRMHGPSLLEGGLFGILGPFLAWFALARLASPIFVALDDAGDPTGITLE
jgi:hypothetical protein